MQPLKTVRQLGLQTKIIIVFVVAVVCLLAVSTFIAMLLTRQPVEEEVYRRALAQARLAAHNLVNEQALQNSQKLGRILRQMQHDIPGVSQADVYLHQGSHPLIATTEPEDSHRELDSIPEINDPRWASSHLKEFERAGDQYTIETPDGKSWIISTALRDQGKSTGCLILTVSKLRSNVITQAIVEGNFLLMLFSLVVLISVIHGFFLKSVRAPVKDMVRVMEAAEGGRLNVRARRGSEDEIGQLAGHLNRMLERIENFNNELARKIRDATLTLEQRNDELTRINEELFETQKSLARSERLAVAGQLAASLAHEIGTPLNSISGHVQLMARQKAGSETTDRRRLQIIQKQIDNIVRIVKQLLSWTHKFDLRLEPVDLRRVLEESVMLSSPALELRKIKVHTDFCDRCPRVDGDVGYLQQVFLNLINNSIDAMPRGGTLHLRLRFPANGDEGSLAVEVEDTGEGIAPETLDHIFDPMFTTKKMGTGAGLGLAICHQIVQQHGGRIEVESELNRGARFRITLPLEGREKTAEAAAVTANRN